MRRSSLVVAVLLATLASGCVFGPTMTIECDLSPGLMTQDDCDQAVNAALRMLPDESKVTKVVAAPGCPGYWRGCARNGRGVIGVEISFAGTTQRAQFAVDQTTWKPGGPTYTSEAPSTP
jgi:hypothetical protein